MTDVQSNSTMISETFEDGEEKNVLKETTLSKDYLPD